MVNIALRMVVGTAVLMAILFGCAGRWDLPFVWAYLAVLAGTMLAAIRVIDPGLMRERARPGPGGVDRKLRFIALPFFVGHLVVAALDAGRFHWSGSMPIGVQVAALLALAGSLTVSIRAVSVNRFFSPVVRIQSERGHHLVDVGPYRWIRHPGYAAAFASMVCGGPALGSWWSILPLVPMFVLILRRTVIEDRYLHDHLEGYVDYARRVRYRLLPGIW